MPKERKMTALEAADFLNVSYSFLIKLLEEGKIPYSKEGAHRRIHFQDLMRYKDQRNINRQQGLQELTQFLQDEGFYDEESFKFEQ